MKFCEIIQWNSCLQAYPSHLRHTKSACPTQSGNMPAEKYFERKFCFQVICVVCNETHTTLTDSYLWADASKHMHVRDLSDGEFVCEWCRLCGCLSCGSFCTVGSDLARPGLWKIPKHFICTVCIQACSTRRDKTDVSPLFKVSSYIDSLLVGLSIRLC